VALAPGTAFGSIGEGWVRIALCGKQEDLVEGLGRLPGRIHQALGSGAEWTG
jgi:aspartate aminotransferase